MVTMNFHILAVNKWFLFGVSIKFSVHDYFIIFIKPHFIYIQIFEIKISPAIF